MSEAIEDSQLMLPRIMWGSFLMTQVVFGGVGYMVAPPPAQASDPLVAWVIAGLGAMIALATLFVMPMLARKLIAPNRAASPDAKPMALVFTPFILGLALREAGAIFALVALILSGDFLIWLAPAGLAFASTALAFPSRETFREWLRP